MRLTLEISCLEHVCWHSWLASNKYKRFLVKEVAREQYLADYFQLAIEFTLLVFFLYFGECNTARFFSTSVTILTKCCETVQGCKSPLTALIDWFQPPACHVAGLPHHEPIQLLFSVPSMLHPHTDMGMHDTP